MTSGKGALYTSKPAVEFSIKRVPVVGGFERVTVPVTEYVFVAGSQTVGPPVISV
jgi:hypothetical protein